MKYIALLIVVIAFSGCKSFVQVVETKTTNTKIVDEEYVFENDSIKITYDFWRDKGSLKFTVYNKKDLPLYIDWKKSSYINNTVKRNYWQNEESSVTDSYYQYIYGGRSKGTKTTKSVKPEKVTFIPPKSNFIKAQFYILPREFNVVYSDKKKVQSLVRPNKEIEIKEKVYNKANTPLIFRNFLTLSFSESFDTEFYVDNEFYLTKVSELNAKDFSEYMRDPDSSSFYKTDENGKRIRFMPYASPMSFYIKIAD